MQADFWHQRWRDNQIGFHLDAVNPYLRMYWSHLQLPAGARVLVPLCGKSLDLIWLRQQGYHVIGVELSPIAVDAFFSEQRLCPQTSSEGQISGHATDGLEIWCGDFFAMQPSQIGKIDAVYDRAALIALPETMRSLYVEQLTKLAGRVPQLLITLDYPQAQMAGPPFSLGQVEVQQLYRGYPRAPSPLVCYDVLSEHAHFAEKGLSQLLECVYLLAT